MSGNGTETKAYLLDTNVFRYKSSPSAHTNHKKAAKRFWKDVLQEVRHEEAVLYIPKEVIRELELQSYTLGEKERQRISELLENITIMIPDWTTPDMEHQVRKMVAYIRSEYQRKINAMRDMEYGSVSDARILLTAWQYDCILVTANIKDFALYPLLFPQHEHRLLNLLSNDYIIISPSIYDTIHHDPIFTGMLQELNDFINR